MRDRLTTREEAQILESVAKVAKGLSDDVASVSYTFDEDWVGEESIFIWVELAEHVTPRQLTWTLIGPIHDAFHDALEGNEVWIRPYVRFTGLGGAPPSAQPIAA